MNSPKTKRRWFRFSLRTMFVVVTVVCVWLAYHLNWIRQRHEALKRSDVVTLTAPVGQEPFAPLSLRILGEQGYEVGLVGPIPESEVEKLENLKKLFPESTILKMDWPRMDGKIILPSR